MFPFDFYYDANIALINARWSIKIAEDWGWDNLVTPSNVYTVSLLYAIESTEINIFVVAAAKTISTNL